MVNSTCLRVQVCSSFREGWGQQRMSSEVCLRLR